MGSAEKQSSITKKEMAYDVLRDMGSKDYWDPVFIIDKVSKNQNTDISKIMMTKIIPEWCNLRLIYPHEFRPGIYRRADVIPFFPPSICPTHMNMWRTLRMLKTCTSEDLAAQSNVGWRNAKRWLQTLRHAGYTKFQNKQWRLIDDSGQLPPRLSYQKGKLQIWDRNKKELKYEQH